MSGLVLRTVRPGTVVRREFGKVAAEPMAGVEDELCGGERVIDFALCLILSASIVGLLLLAF